MYVIKCLNSTNPFGEWSNETRLLPEEDIWAVDGTVLQNNDQNLYFIWAGQTSQGNASSVSLYIAKMETLQMVLAPRTLLRLPTMDWESRGSPSNRAPAIIQKDRRTLLVFTASSPESPDVCLGIMGIECGKDPMLAENWWNDVNHCVFEKNEEEKVWATGYASFVMSPGKISTM